MGFQKKVTEKSLKIQCKTSKLSALFYLWLSDVERTVCGNAAVGLGYKEVIDRHKKCLIIVSVNIFM